MDKKQQELVELTRQLVAIESTNIGCFEYKIAEFVENWLEKETGIKPERNYIIQERYNVVIEKKGEIEDPALVILCHMDTVPIGSGWSENPLGGEIKDAPDDTTEYASMTIAEHKKTRFGKRLYGRGSADMKAGLAVGMLAFRDLVNSDRQLKRTVRFIATADEEIEMHGAMQAVNSGLVTKNSYAIDMEPSAEEIIVGHKGKIWFRINAYGKPAHGSMPWEGIPSILAISHVVAKINDKVGEMEADPQMGKSSVCFGTLEAGDNINVVADKASLEIDFRFVPPYTEKDAMEMLDGIFEEVRELVEGIKLDYEVISIKPCIGIKQDSPLIQTFIETVKEVEGREIVPEATTGYTDTGVVAAMTGNEHGMSYGPMGGAIHQMNEWVDCDSIYRVYQICMRAFEKLVS